MIRDKSVDIKGCRDEELRREMKTFASGVYTHRASRADVDFSFINNERASPQNIYVQILVNTPDIFEKDSKLTGQMIFITLSKRLVNQTEKCL